MSTLNLFHRILRQVRPYWPHLAVIFAVGLLATPIALLLPVPLKVVVDSVIGDHPLPSFLAAAVPEGLVASPGALLGFAVVLLIVVTFLNLLQALANSVLREFVGERMVLDFRSRLFEHVQRVSLAFHDSQGTTHSTYRIQWDAPAIRWLTLDGVIPFVVALFTFAAMLFVTANINLKLALVALVVSPAVVILTHVYSRRLRQRWRHAHSLQSAAFGIVQEVLGALRVVKAFGQEQRESGRFLSRSQSGVAARIQAMWMESSLNLLLGLTVALGTAAVLYVGVSDIQAGKLTLGQLLLIMAYLAQLYGPLQSIGKQVAGQQQSLACLERAFELLDQAPTAIERPGAMPIARAEGSVAFDHVWFGYNGCSPVLRDITFQVPAGTRVGIAGPTGAGKSTLLSLLIRFNDPSRGQILLDGACLRDYQLHDLRNQFAVVLQEPVLFSTTVAENIAYAKPGVSEDEIVAAARAANAHDFILGLPEAYDTVVGERGMRLSGGERQRVSLARAFLKNAPILILDEPTSSVDSGTEAVIVEAMDRLMQGRTTFMIAHRLTTLKSCDILLKLRNGRLVSTTSESAVANQERTQIARVHGSADA